MVGHAWAMRFGASLLADLWASCGYMPHGLCDVVCEGVGFGMVRRLISCPAGSEEASESENTENEGDGWARTPRRADRH